MDLLESVKQMQQQGIPDASIVQSLKEQGFSPKDIDDALSQSKIKSAIYEQTGQDSVINNSQADMQQSMMTQEVQEQAPMPMQYQTYEQPQQEYSYYQPQQSGVSPETITDIAEQIVSEKISALKKNIGNISDFKSIADSKISNIDERLKKIEKTIENLQMSILNKVSGNLQSIEDIKSEMSMMQESFSKAINPIVDRQRARQVQENIGEQQNTEEQTSKKQEARKQGKKTKPDFEDYLR